MLIHDHDPFTDILPYTQRHLVSQILMLGQHHRRRKNPAALRLRLQRMAIARLTIIKNNLDEQFIHPPAQL